MRVGSPRACENRRSCRTRRRRLRRTRTSAYHCRCPAGAACCHARNDHAAVMLALLGTAAAAVDDQTDDVDDRADACPPPVWAASFYGSGDAALILVQAKLDAENAVTPTTRPGTPALRLLSRRLRTGTTTRCRCWCYRPRRTSTRPRRTTAQRLLWQWPGNGARTR